MVQSEIRKVLSKAKAAGVLRMAFHDAGTFDVDDKSGIYLTSNLFNVLLNAYISCL